MLVHIGVDQHCAALDVESSTNTSAPVAMDIATFEISHSIGCDMDTSAVIASRVIVHVCVGQRCRAFDVESSAILPTMSTRNVLTALNHQALRYMGSI